MDNKYVRKVIAGIVTITLPLLASAQSIHITPGCKFTASGGVYVVLNNTSLINDGSFVPGNSAVLFTGSNNAGIGGGSATTFFNISLNKPSAELQLNRDVSLSGSISMNSGRLQLNFHTLSLGFTGNIVGESNESNITGGGSVTVTRTLAPGIPANPGNIGVEILAAGKSNVLTITRDHIARGLQGGGQAIQRGFTIQSPSPAGNGRLRFNYLDVELDASDEPSLIIWTGSGAGNFLTRAGRDSIDNVSNWVMKNGISITGLYTLGNEGGAATMGISKKPIIPQRERSEINAPGKIRVKVFPNPVQSNCIMELYSREKKAFIINLYNADGKLLQQRQVLCTAGLNRINWDLSGYATGAYYLEVKDRSMQVLKIIKR